MHTRPSKFPTASLIAVCALAISGALPCPSSAQTPAVSPPSGATSPINSDYNIREFGAVGDGKTLDSDAINRAIEAAAKAGGGTIRVPAGTYLSLSIRLKSNIRLHLDAGATIEAAKGTPESGYDAPEANDFKEFQDFGHSHFRNSLIWGENLNNVTIDGPGEINGKNLRHTNSAKDVGTANKSISLKLCRNVTMKDFTIRRGGWFAILATGVDNLTIDNLKIDTNRDGMDIDCCRNVRISNCSVNAPGDDAICLKSSYALNEARATENVTISNCFVSGYKMDTMLNGTRLYDYKEKPGASPNGRIKFGTESNGGFKNITISNCIFEKCRGLALETVDGGLLEDVTISNITMRDVNNAPIFLRLGRRMRGPEGAPVGKLRRVNISNVVIYNAESTRAAILSGIPGHPIEDVSLSNIQIWLKGGGTAEQAAIVPDEAETDYPEPFRMGEMPAYGFYLRHIKGLTMDNIQLHTMSDDARPPFVLDDVNSAEFFRVKADRTAGVNNFAFKNSSDLTMRMVEGTPDKQD